QIPHSSTCTTVLASLPLHDALPTSLIEAAADAGQYVVLDFQPGGSSFLEQVHEYEELLAYPHVGIALDPEWRLKPDQVHLQQIEIGRANVLTPVMLKTRMHSSP